ncbi:hypothetical protein [Burkholderia mayonis]|uniref:Uncharacterized protein n=1 Tax=Burkholderia mayonis TaxID=1385591 RepID=A0A1B4G3T3_9BURK|nr:hypothetical protein [Burkholderia mayonis]AOJ10577.1 hypothetical protein WS71_25710 [Burkholderia mayonis]KVE53232.1 hypothetical protein WS71_08220 [Burkholderia mayonis]
MPLPQICCPNCRAVMSLDIVFADDAPREALNAIVDAHPAGETFVKPLLRYIGLFAPAKSQMSHSRVALLINELAPMIRAARIERNGRTWPCPIDYWRQGFEHMLSQRDQGRLKLPLKSHGYLLEVLAGFSDKAESRSESHLERQRQGHSGLGTPDARASPTAIVPPVLAVVETGSRQMTPEIEESLSKLRRLTKEMNTFTREGKIHD